MLIMYGLAWQNILWRDWRSNSCKKDDLIEGLFNGPYGLNDQLRELLCFHPRVDLCVKSLLELAGLLPTDLLFDWLNMPNCINIETPDYFDENDRYAYSDKYMPDGRKRIILWNAEDISTHVPLDLIDLIFFAVCSLAYQWLPGSTWILWSVLEEWSTSLLLFCTYLLTIFARWPCLIP